MATDMLESGILSMGSSSDPEEIEGSVLSVEARMSPQTRILSEEKPVYCPMNETSQ